MFGEEGYYTLDSKTQMVDIITHLLPQLHVFHSCITILSHYNHAQLLITHINMPHLFVIVKRTLPQPCSLRFTSAELHYL